MSAIIYNFLKKAYLYIKNGAYFIWEKFIYPRSQDEDLKRREFILNILLIGSLILSFVAVIGTIFDFFIKSAYRGANPVIFIIVFLLFCFLLFLSRRGRFVVASRLFLAIYIPPIIYTLYKWGISVPQAILSLGLIIIMAGILISARFAFVITFFISGAIFIIEYLHINSIVTPNLYWQKELYGFDDAMTFIATFFVIALVSWLSNREMEKSLNRARKSEAELKKERDSLEIKVKERTEELQKMQMEKLIQMYRFVEFGRLAAGVFHDVTGKIAAVSLNLEHLKKADNQKDIKEDLKRLFSAGKSMDNFLSAARKQIQNQEATSLFSLNKEIKDAISIFNYKAKKANVELNFEAEKDIKIYGNPLKFNQTIANLISNAIDSYESVGFYKQNISPFLLHDHNGHKDGNIFHKDGDDWRVLVNLFVKDDIARIVVRDFGCGITRENMKKIFEPFFTTKNLQYGSGIGLASAKEIIEKNFKGEIKVKSAENKGTTFTVILPIYNGKH